MTKQQDLKELKGGFFSLDIGDTFVQLDIDGLEGLDGNSDEPDEFAIDANLQKNFGGAKDYGNATQPIRMPVKRFKEDEDDFYDSRLFSGGSRDKRINR